MTKKTLAEIVTIFEAAYNVSLTEEQQAVWFQLLEPLDDHAVKSACIECARTAVYPPKPADIWTRCRTEGDRMVPGIGDTQRRIAAIRGESPAQHRIADMTAKIGKPMPT